jgi:hypothetical protein
MSKKSILFIAFLVLSPVIIYFLWPSDESRIKKLFREGVKAVESKKTDDIMSKVSFNYTDEHGMSYLVLKQSVERVFSQTTNIMVECELKQMDIKGDSATVGMDIRVIATSGNDTGYFVGDAARSAHMTFTLEKERTKWLVTRTEGLPVGF